jgi:hypothetical protein
MKGDTDMKKKTVITYVEQHDRYTTLEDMDKDVPHMQELGYHIMDTKLLPNSKDGFIYEIIYRKELDPPTPYDDKGIIQKLDDDKFTIPIDIMNKLGIKLNSTVQHFVYGVNLIIQKYSQ